MWLKLVKISGGNRIMNHAINRRITLWVLIIGAIALIAAIQIYNFAHSSAEREIQSWQISLSADARVQAQNFEIWASELQKNAEGLAENTSVKLYLSTRGDESDPALIAAQQDYLRNLLVITAQTLGLQVTDNSPIKANIRREVTDSLTLVDKSGAVIAGLGAKIGQIAAIEQVGISLKTNAQGERILEAINPVFGVQGEEIIGGVILRQSFDTHAASLLVSEAQYRITRQSQLARRDQDSLDIILGPDAGASYPLDANGPFLDLLLNDEAHIAVAVPIEGLGLVLLHSVSKDAVLTPIYERRTFMMVTMGLVLIVLIIAILLAWKQGTSLRMERALEQEERLRRTLKLVADKQPTAVLIVDEQQKILFANEKAAGLSGGRAEELQNKALTAVFGPAASQPFHQMLQMVNSEKNWADIICPIDFGHGQRLGRLSGAPLAEGEMADNAVLLVWDDLTEVITAQKKREKSLEDLTSLLTGMIDARDRYSATQGAQIAELSGPMSAALDYDNATRHLLDLSAKLLNLGKVLVPPDILTKAGKLEPEELKIVQDAKAKTAELLKDIDFDVPVLSVIEEAGSKDKSVSGPAGALRVMNDFVSMVSPRAHRKALNIDDALEALKLRADYYDAAAVSALAHVLDNKGGRALVAKWQSAEIPKVLPAL